MSGDILGFLTGGGGGDAIGIWRVEAGHSAQCPITHTEPTHVTEPKMPAARG